MRRKQFCCSRKNELFFQLCLIFLLLNNNVIKFIRGVENGGYVCYNITQSKNGHYIWLIR